MEFTTIPEKLNAMIVTIRTKRELKGFSQLYIASRLNISQSAYSKVELGQTKITINTLIAIADVLDVQVTVLIN